MNRFILVLLTLSVGIVTYEFRNPTERFEQLSAKTLPTAVGIKVEYRATDPLTGKQRRLGVSGAGVFVTSDGNILTCAHLFNLPYKRGNIATIELYSGEIVAGEIIVVSKKYDLALVKANVTGVKYLQLADPRKLRVGQEVIAIGNPLGFDFTVTHGIISALYRDVSDNYNVTQHDVFMNPGNSGGPVINLRGELVGINSFIISQIPFFPTFTGLGFSVQSGQCLEFLTFNGKTISPHRRYKWLRVLNDAKQSFSIQR